MIAIIDYRAGNLKSVERALHKLGFPCRVTHDTKEIQDAERIVFPGVGAAGKAMADLENLGLDRAIREAFEKGKPILGICLGAQIVLEKSQENRSRCLGLIRGEVRQFPSPLISEQGERLKIPHMGWNRVRPVKDHPVLQGIGEEDEFYFVHSYYPVPALRENVAASTDYGIAFSSVIGYENLLAMQFHPEKSGAPGLRLLKNFCEWDGSHAE